MQISLRSQLIAGTAAVVGASAIAMTPVPAVHLSAPALHLPSTAQVTLAGLDSPLTEFLKSVAFFGDNFFNWDFVYTGPLVAADGVTPINVWVGIVPGIIDTGLPILSELGYNGSAYINGLLAGVSGAAITASEALWNLPGAVSTAFQQAIGGDIPGAITTLTNATIVPLQQVFADITEPITAIVANVIAVATNLLTALPAIGQDLLGSVVGGASAIFNAALVTVQGTITALGGGDFEAAWNTAVNGLFGPIGIDRLQPAIPGQLINATVGSVTWDGSPSLRFAAQSAQDRIANAISQTPLGTGNYWGVLPTPSAVATVEPAATVAAPESSAGAARAAAAASAAALSASVTSAPVTSASVMSAPVPSAPVPSETAAGPIAAGPIAAGPIAAGPIAAGPIAAPATSAADKAVAGAISDDAPGAAPKSAAKNSHRKAGAAGRAASAGN